jgi:hypothetical protein
MRQLASSAGKQLEYLRADRGSARNGFFFNFQVLEGNPSWRTVGVVEKNDHHECIAMVYKGGATEIPSLCNGSRCYVRTG